MFEQAVIVTFNYGSTDLGPLFELEDQLIAAIDAAGAGEFDGNEVATDGSDGSLYMYGPDADRLFEAVRPVLASATCIQQAVAIIRSGTGGLAMAPGRGKWLLATKVCVQATPDYPCTAEHNC